MPHRRQRHNRTALTISVPIDNVSNIPLQLNRAAITQQRTLSCKTFTKASLHYILIEIKNTAMIQTIHCDG